MRLSIIGMSGGGKSHWSKRLARHGFTRYCCDDLISHKLKTVLTRPDGTAMGLGEWMGMPYEPQYREREKIYLDLEVEVLDEILEILEPRQRAHSPLRSAGLASEIKNGCHPYGDDSPWLATGNLQKEKDRPGQNVVVDTTGSVIYTGDERLQRLRRLTTVIHLATPPEVQAAMLKKYLRNQRPVLWQGFFQKEDNETNDEAIARCYPKLLAARELLYEHYGEITLDYPTRTQSGFGPEDFIKYVMRAPS